MKIKNSTKFIKLGLLASAMLLFIQPKSYAVSNSYQIDLNLNSDQRKLQGSEEVTIYNNSKDNLDKVFFLLGLNNSYDTKISITEVTNAENVVLPSSLYKYNYLGQDIEDKAIYQVTLPTPIAPNESAILKLKFEVNNLSKINNVLFLDDNVNDIYISSWYPRAINFDNGAYKKRDFTLNNYDVTISVGKDETVSASSIEISNEKIRTKAQKKLTYKLDKARGFSLAISELLSSESEETKDGNIIRFFYKNNKAPKFNKNILDATKEIMEFYHKKLGFYPYKQLNIVLGNPSLKNVYANANMVIINDNFDKYESFKDFENEIKWYLAYGIAQQYFLQYMGESGDYPKWISFGSSLYFAQTYMREKNISEDTFNKYIRQYVSVAKAGFNTKMLQPTDELRTANFDWENILEKGKSAQIFKLLEYSLGRKPLQDAMKEIATKYQNSFVTLEKFQAVLESKTNKKLDDFFTQWIKENKRLDYAIVKITQEKKGDKFVLGLTLRKVGRAIIPVSIAITFKNGNKAFQVWDGEKTETELTYEYNDQVKSVQLDSAGILPDVDRENNKANAPSK